jgi:hypothetical protein
LVGCHRVAVLHIGEWPAIELFYMQREQSLLYVAHVDTIGLSPPDQEFIACRELPNETTTCVTGRSPPALLRISPQALLQAKSASGFPDVDDLGIIAPCPLEDTYIDREGFPLVRATDTFLETRRDEAVGHALRARRMASNRRIPTAQIQRASTQ